MKRFLYIIVILCMVFSYSTPYAENLELKNTGSVFDSDEDEDFEDSEFEEEHSSKDEKEKSFSNNFRFTLSYNFGWGTEDPEETIIDRTSIRSEFEKSLTDIFFIKFDGKGICYFENDHIAEAEETSSETSTDIREFYISTVFEKLTFKIGKQIIVWGETDGDVVNDIVSPRNLTEFLFIDLEDARVGQYIISMDHFTSYGDFLYFVTFKPSIDKSPEEGTRYYREIGITTVDDKTNFSDREYGFRWKRTFGKFDIAFMTASVFQNSSVLEHISGSTYEKIYSDYEFFGFSASYTKGRFLFKMDNSFKNDFPLQGQNVSGEFVEEQRDIIDSAIAVEYDSNGKFVMNLELTNRYITDYSTDLYGVEKNNTGLYYLISSNFLNETLAIQYAIYFIFKEESFLHKVAMDYSLTDDIKLILNYTIIDTNDENSTFASYKNEDRAGFKIKYFF
jgi:hypothetical protein